MSVHSTSPQFTSTYSESKVVIVVGSGLCKFLVWTKVRTSERTRNGASEQGFCQVRLIAREGHFDVGVHECCRRDRICR